MAADQPTLAQLDDLYRLDGKVVIVTGSSSGLGVACAAAFARAGANIALGARRHAALSSTAELVESAGSRALAVPTDVTDPEACARLAQATIEEFGRIDVLVNNAGIATAVPAFKEGPDEFARVVDANLQGSFNMAKEAASRMEHGGSVINVSSVLALTTAGLPQAAYASSKAALLGLTRDLAQQWGPRRGIRVNAICPGFFPSEMTDQYHGDYVERVLGSRCLLNRPGHPREFAGTAVFLASPAGAYITGATIVVDGGVTIT